MHEHDVHPHHIHPAWDGVSSILATVLSVSFSLLPYKLFLDIRFVCLLASVCLFPMSLSLHPAAGPGLFFWVASLGGLHVGHFKTDTASRLRGRLLDRFCLMSFRTVATSSLSMACHLMIRRSYVRASQTGIECQQDRLRGGGKSYTHIWHVAVITWPWAEGGRVDGGTRARVEHDSARGGSALGNVVFCLRNIHA